MLDTTGTLQLAERIRRSARARKGKARGVLAVAIGGLLCIMPNAGSSDIDAPKQYIDFKTYSFYLLDWNKEQHICLLKLYGKESAWNPEAKNGSHYGIPQGRSEYLARVDGYKQIQWGLKYIHNHRLYQGNTCKAWQHWIDKGWH